MVAQSRPGWHAAGLLTALLGLACPAHAQADAEAPPSVTVSVDATSAGTPLTPVWSFYGYDEVNYTTSDEGRALLGALVSANTAPTYVRSHFLLNTGDGTPALKWGSTNVYTEDAAGNPVYDWGVTDGILQAITGAGARPFVELGFMPEALSSHPQPYRNSSPKLLDGGSFYPPRDYAAWAELVRSWATHANDNYPDVASSWLWELWNEPDLPYWHGTPAEFFTLYDYTEAALHQVLPDAQLGGPAVAGAGGLFLKDFLEHCATGSNAVDGATGTRLDHVTFHAKGGVAISGDHVQMDLGSQLRIHRAGFNSVTASPELARTPIYITEADPDGCAACPSSERPENAYRTSTAYGAYELAMMKRSLELAELSGVDLRGVLTWAFTFPEAAYFAGYRELASHGVQLPVLSALQLLGRLAGTRLPLSSSGAKPLQALLDQSVRDQVDVDGMATRQGDTVQVLLWSYHDDLVPAAATPLQVSVQLPPGWGERARVSHLRVDESHGNAHALWVSQGEPQPPSAAQRAALLQAMEPSPLVADEVVAVSASGLVSAAFELPRFGVSLLTLTPTTAPLTPDPSTPETAAGGCSCHVGVGEPWASSAWSWALTSALLAAGLRRRRAQ